jgi:hypothetical protein
VEDEALELEDEELDDEELLDDELPDELDEEALEELEEELLELDEEASPSVFPPQPPRKPTQSNAATTENLFICTPKIQ